MRTILIVDRKSDCAAIQCHLEQDGTCRYRLIEASSVATGVELLRVLSRALRRKGFCVTSAVSVESACEQFTQQPADLIICDIVLPDGTGWDMLRRLRESGPVRAIAVSGYGMNQDFEKSRAAGFAAHVTKPLDFSQLETIVARVLQTSPLN